MENLPLTIDKIKGKTTYVNDEVGEYLLNCHIGHRKLLCVVLEFLLECQKNNIDLDDSFVIYIGSAPGISLNVINILYPNLKWLCYDKNKFLIENTTNYIFVNNYFYDSTILEAKKYFKESGKKYFLFICDMRDEPQEDIVFNDMIMQQRWLLDLEVDAFSLKFRLPYFITTKKYKYDIPIYFKNKKVEFNDNKLIYLDGKIFIQTYAPKRSTETRLIAFKPHKLAEYDIVEYEEKCSYLNTVLRNKKFTYKNSNEYLFYNEYDDVREYQIFYDYNEFNHNFNTINDMYALVNSVFNKYKISNNIECKFKMFYTRVNDIIEDPHISEDKKNTLIKFLYDKMQIIIDKLNDKIKNNHNDYKNLKIHIDNKFIKYDFSKKKFYIDTVLLNI